MYRVQRSESASAVRRPESTACGLSPAGRDSLCLPADSRSSAVRLPSAQRVALLSQNRLDNSIRQLTDPRRPRAEWEQGPTVRHIVGLLGGRLPSASLSIQREERQEEETCPAFCIYWMTRFLFRPFWVGQRGESVRNPQSRCRAGHLVPL